MILPVSDTFRSKIDIINTRTVVRENKRTYFMLVCHFSIQF